MAWTRSSEPARRDLQQPGVEEDGELLHAVHAVQGEDTGDVLVGAHDDDRPVS